MNHDEILKLWREYEGRGADAVVQFAQAIETAEREKCAKALEQAADDSDEWRPLDGTRGMALRAASKGLRGA